jgi:site-specific DNA-methyltransferase (adenine-specific)
MEDKTNNERGITMLPMSAIEINNGQLEGLPKNPRLIKNAKYDKLKESITNYPEMLSWRSLLVYPLDNGKYIIVGGNMRYRAMKELGHKEAPVFIIPKETPIEKIRAYTILDNNGFGEWDWDLLANEWETFELDDWGVDLPAFDESTDDEDGDEGNVAEDDFDEDKDDVEPRTNKGDIWVLGEHRLMCGDSTKASMIQELLSGEKVDLYITDPPYNAAYEGGTKDALTILNDEMDDDGFRDFLVNAFMAVDSALKEGASFYIWHADSEGYNFRYAVKHCGWLMKQCLIWKKNAMVLGRQDYQWKHEPCLYGWKAGASHNWYSDRKQTTVLEFNKPNRNAEHPTMKPIELFAYQIQNSSRKGDIVLDSFGGSGTSIIACEQLNRKCYMMELDPHYCDVIVARWEKLTGKTAQKLSKVRNDTKR